MDVAKMAQALIDIHNALPVHSEDVDEGEWSGILAELWSVLNRFPHNELEKIADQGFETLSAKTCSGHSA